MNACINEHEFYHNAEKDGVSSDTVQNDDDLASYGADCFTSMIRMNTSLERIIDLTDKRVITSR